MHSILLTRIVSLACLALATSNFALASVSPAATSVPRKYSAKHQLLAAPLPDSGPAGNIAQSAEWYPLQNHELEAELSPVPTPTTLAARDDVPTVPLSSLPYPTFPPQYPSCVKCQKEYPSISSCMKASSVFANASSIFNDPISYVAVIQCACTDTFQSAYPQCVDCFQHTDQCWWLGTDPAGTGAPKLVTNIRQICGFGSALLGGVAGANGMNHSHNVSVVPTYTDVSSIGPGYIDHSSGPFRSAAALSSQAGTLLPLLFTVFAGVYLLHV